MQPNATKSPTFFPRIQSVLTSIRFWWMLAAVYAATQAWFHRYAINGDGISYLDRATHSLAEGPGALVNGYWSPVYPALIAGALFVFKPSAEQEFPLIHLVNFFVFLLALGSFTFFLKAWIRVRDQISPDAGSKHTYLIPFGFGVFLWCILAFVPLDLCTPDLCVVCVVFLTAGVCCRISTDGSWRHYVSLGWILAFGYYTKQPMLPISVILLDTLAALQPSSKVRRSGFLLATCVLLLSISPLVWLISMKLGHFSLGETGSLNYAWYVNGLTADGDWIGDPGSPHGTPVHPPRVLTQKPFTLEFATPIGGTFPLWYDPAYWYAGARAHFNPRQQIVRFVKNLRYYIEACAQASGLLAGLFCLCVLLAGQRCMPRVDRTLAWMLAWPAAVVVMYLLVHLDVRFLGAFAVLFFLSAYEQLLPAVTASVRTAVLVTVLFALFIPLTIKFVTEPILQPLKVEDRVIAQQLSALGVRRGDRIAIAGTGYRHYYARRAGLQIVAEVVRWEQPSQAEFEVFLNRLAGLGVTVLVCPGDAHEVATADWHAIIPSDFSRFSVLRLSSQLPAGVPGTETR